MDAYSDLTRGSLFSKKHSSVLAALYVQELSYSEAATELAMSEEEIKGIEEDVLAVLSEAERTVQVAEQYDIGPS